MTKISKILVAGAIILSLAGCSSSSPDTGTTPATSTNPSKITYESTDFKITVPRDWEILDSETLPVGSPLSVVVAFKNNIKTKKFIANVSVSKFDIKDEKTTQEEAVKSIKDNLKNTLIDFTAATDTKISINAKGLPIEGILSQFTGKSDAAENAKTIKQLYIKYNNSAYIVVASYTTDEDPEIIAKIDSAINSLELK